MRQGRNRHRRWNARLVVALTALRSAALGRGLGAVARLSRRTSSRSVRAIAVPLVLATLTLAASPETDTRRWHRHTDVQGRVLAEAPTSDAARCAWLQDGEESQGRIGWVVELAPDEGDGHHRYELFRDGVRDDLDVTFYADLGSSCASTGRPLQEEEVHLYEREGTVLGAVPADARYAVLGRWSVSVRGPYYVIPPYQVQVGAGAAVDFRFSVHEVPVDGVLQEPFDGDPATSESLPAGRPDLTVEISRARFDGKTATHAVLTRMDVFSDSLAAAALTAEGPLLGVWSDRLPATVAEELRRVLPGGETVYLLGGVEAISEGVERDVATLGYEVRRLAGATRVETAIAVADQVRALNPDVREVGLARAFGVSGDDSSAWADSVTAGGWAADRHVPILVTDTERMHPAVDEWLREDRPRRTVLFGGHAALSGEVEQAAPQPQRIWGADRSETARRIVERLWNQEPSGRRDFVIVNGWADLGWLWGLAAAGASADHDAPILFVSGTDVPEATAGFVSRCGKPEVDLLVSGSSDHPRSGVTPAVIRRLDDLDGGAC